MENCLVTKLKGSVNNNNLIKLGYMLVGSYLPDNQKNFYMRFKKESKVRCLNGTFKSTGTRERTYAGEGVLYSGNDIIPDNPDATVITLEVPKYSDSWTYCRNICGTAETNIIDASFLEYVDDGSDISFLGSGYTPVTTVVKNFKIEYAKKMFTSSTSFYLSSCILDINLTLLGENLSNDCASINMSQTVGCTGSLDSVGKRTNIISLIPPSSKNVTLDLVNFVNFARAAERTTGSVNIKFADAITIKANGVIIPLTPSSDNMLEWTADSITFKGNPIS